MWFTLCSKIITTFKKLYTVDDVFTKFLPEVIILIFKWPQPSRPLKCWQKYCIIWPLSLKVADLIADDCTQKYTCLTRKYKLVIDKGTYDAISLIPGDDITTRQAYLKTVKQILSSDGVFVITSCNWTKEQLLHFWETGKFI